MICYYTGSRNLYPSMKPAIESLLDHNKADVVLLVEDDDVGWAVPDCVRIVNVSEVGKEMLKHSPNFGTRFTYLALIRVAASKFIDADRVIQLDCDTIVCDSLNELWNVDFDGCHYAAVPEYKGTFKPYGDRYYNAGVMVQNLKLIRETGMDNKMINWLNTNRVPYIDQDAFNCMCKAKELPVRFNECFCCGETDNPAIVHYAGVTDWYNGKQHRYEYLEKYKNR